MVHAFYLVTFFHSGLSSSLITSVFWSWPASETEETMRKDSEIKTNEMLALIYVFKFFLKPETNNFA